MTYLALLLLFALGQGERTDRLRSVEWSARGPLAAAELDAGEAGRARLGLELATGASERAVGLVPSPARGLSPPVEPRFEGTGELEVTLRPELDRERAARFEALPRMLRARAPIAPPGARLPRPPLAALFLVAGLFALGWPLRRRAGASLALGGLGALGVFLLSSGAGDAPTTFVVAEGHGPQPEFVLVETARERLFIGGFDDVLRLESRPLGAPLVFESTPGEADLAVRGEGASLFAFRDGAGLSAAWDHNGVFDLERTWYRAPGAQGWVELGPWGRGEALGAPPDPTDSDPTDSDLADSDLADSGPAGSGPGGSGPGDFGPGMSSGPAAEADAPRRDPPGWLVGSLPQGVGVLVGGGGARWIRWVGIENPGGEH